MSDVVSRLLAAIDETANHGPSADLVLRLCQAHRDIVAEYEKHKQLADQLQADPQYRHGQTHLTVVGITAGLRVALVRVARGFGVEDGETK